MYFSPQYGTLRETRRFADHGYGSFIVRYRGSDAEEKRQQLQMFAADLMAKA